ncbi:MAG TPA: tetratricopeptide repeat protein [Geminicoccaceae bacterium]|nr:tetratricopeptide repeat protein [Geminicoccaceae bacterium]
MLLLLTLGLLTPLLLGACARTHPFSSGTADGSGRTVSIGAVLDPDRSPGAAGSYLAGRFAMERGDLRQAAASFGEALAADPDNLELRRQVFVLRLASGQLEEALAEARTLEDIDPDSEEVRLLLALASVRAGDFAAARRQLGAVPTRGIGSVSLPILGAWAEFGQGHREAAIEALATPRDEEVLAPLRRYHQAAMLALAGRAAEARARLAPLVSADQSTPIRIVLALASLEMQSGDRAAATRLLESRVAATDGSLVLADALARVARGDVPPAPIADAATGMADALLGIAEALHQQGASAQGLLLARLASYLAPEQADVWLLIGRIARDQGNSEEALTAFRRVSAATPQAWEARLAAAEALRDAERIDEAVAVLERMADERIERTDALVALGDLLRREERYAEAEAAYSRAIARAPGMQSQDWRLFYARGIAFERTQRWPEAERDLLKALELAPDQPFVLNYLGYSWVDQGLNLDRAKGMLHRAVELRPQDGFIVDSLGWAYFRLGEHDNAVTYLERAVELEPADPVINDHLGDAYWRVGRQREARFQWQRALTLKPEDDQIAQIEDKLQRGLPDSSADRG